MKKVVIIVSAVLIIYFIQASILDTHIAVLSKGKGVSGCYGLEVGERCLGIISHYYE